MMENDGMIFFKKTNRFETKMKQKQKQSIPQAL